MTQSSSPGDSSHMMIRLDKETAFLTHLDFNEKSLSQLIEKHHILKNKMVHTRKLLEKEKMEHDESKNLLSANLERTEKLEWKISELTSKISKADQIIFEKDLMLEKYHKRFELLEEERDALHAKCRMVEKTMPVDVDSKILSPEHQQQFRIIQSSLSEATTELREFRMKNKSLVKDLIANSEAIVRLKQTIERLTRRSDAGDSANEQLSSKIVELSELNADLTRRYYYHHCCPIVQYSCPHF
jgi:chromosome segregation ATPase